MNFSLPNKKSLSLGVIGVAVYGFVHFHALIEKEIVDSVISDAQRHTVSKIVDIIVLQQRCSESEITKMKQPYKAELFGKTVGEGVVTIEQTKFVSSSDITIPKDKWALRVALEPYVKAHKRFLLISGQAGSGWYKYIRAVDASACPNRQDLLQESFEREDCLYNLKKPIGKYECL